VYLANVYTHIFDNIAQCKGCNCQLNVANHLVNAFLLKKLLARAWLPNNYDLVEWSARGFTNITITNSQGTFSLNCVLSFEGLLIKKTCG